MAGKLIVVLGAAELGLALNDAPHVRHLFFGDGRLGTLEVAESELKGTYALAWWPTFVDREGETGAIRAFMQDRARLVLQVRSARRNCARMRASTLSVRIDLVRLHPGVGDRLDLERVRHDASAGATNPDQIAHV